MEKCSTGEHRGLLGNGQEKIVKKKKGGQTRMALVYGVFIALEPAS
jgi:hypothetical protein